MNGIGETTTYFSAIFPSPSPGAKPDRRTSPLKEKRGTKKMGNVGQYRLTDCNVRLCLPLSTGNPL